MESQSTAVFCKALGQAGEEGLCDKNETHSKVLWSASVHCKLHLCSSSQGAVPWWSFPHVKGAGWGQVKVGTWQSAAPGEMARPSTDQSLSQRSVTRHTYHCRWDLWPGERLVGFRGERTQCRGPTLGTEPLPCQPACWGAACDVGQACTQQSRAWHSALAGLPGLVPGCPAEQAGQGADEQLMGDQCSPVKHGAAAAEQPEQPLREAVARNPDTLGFFSLQWPGQDPKTWRDGVSSKLPSCWLWKKHLGKWTALFCCNSPPIPNGKGNEVRTYYFSCCFKECLDKRQVPREKKQKISDMLVVCNKNTKMV